MCSLAIRLWQQNDTVAQNKAAVDLTDTETPLPPPHHVKVLSLLSLRPSSETIS